MIKADLVREVAKKHGLSRNLSGQIVQTLFDEMANCLVTDSRIELRRFGVFHIKSQALRVITLPSGIKITRPAKKVVTFALSPTVKKKINPPPKEKGTLSIFHQNPYPLGQNPLTGFYDPLLPKP